MAQVQHSALTGSQLHEPKGAAAASVDTVYVSDGAGSGSWRKVAADEVTIADAGGYFTGTEVEAALQELGPAIASIVPIYGMIYLDGNATATTISASATYYQVAPTWTSGAATGITQGTDNFTVDTDGTYWVGATLSFTGATNDTFQFAIGKDTGGGYAALTGSEIERKTSSADVGALALQYVGSFSAGDDIGLLVQNQSATNNCTVTQATMFCYRMEA